MGTNQRSFVPRPEEQTSTATAAETQRAGTRVPVNAPLREERDRASNPGLDPEREAESKVDESSDDSFPASDAPSWTPVQGTTAETDEREHANELEGDEIKRKKSAA